MSLGFPIVVATLGLLPLADGARYAGLFADFETTLWSGVLRMLQAVVAAAPFVVTGAVAAGLLRGLVGPERLRSLLGVGKISGPLRAWLLGILLPVDSLGALPVAAEMRRAGVPGGTVLSFVLVAPVLNPISILYGLSNIVPHTLLFFAIGTFAVSTGIGLIWNRLVGSRFGERVARASRHPAGERDESTHRDGEAATSIASADVDRDTTCPADNRPPGGSRRLMLAAATTARSVVGPVAKDLLLALLAVGVLGAFLPHGVLQTGLTRENALAPVLMGLVAIPAYVTPIDVMMHFGNIVRDGYSLGAAFALIVLGAGANVGVAAWVRRDYGVKPLLLFVALLIGSTLAIGLTADRTLVHGRADAEDHTHAFDSFTRLPSLAGQEASAGWVVRRVIGEIKRNKTSGAAQVVGLGALAVIVAGGVALRVPAVSRWVDRAAAPAPPSVEGRVPDASDAAEGTGLNRELSPRQLAIAGGLTVVGLAVAGLYLLYPPPGELLDEIGDIRLGTYDAIDDLDVVETRRRIAQWRGQLGKLPTALRIRGGSVSAGQLAALSETEHALKTAEQAVIEATRQQAGPAAALRARLMRRHLEDRYRDCATAFRQARPDG